MKLVVDFILVIGILLTIMAIVGILRHQQKKLPQKILIVFWILILNVFIYFYAFLHELKTLEFITFYLELGVRLLISPLIYLYVKSIFQEQPNLIKKNLKHFVVFVVFFLFYIIPVSLYRDSDYIHIIHEYVPNWGFVQDIFAIIYFILSLRLFYRVSGLMKKSYSNLIEKDFLWIEKFLISLLIVLVIDFITVVIEMYFGYNISWDSYITLFFLIIAMVYLGYYGVSQSTMLIPSFLVQKQTDATTVNDKQSYFKEEERHALKTKFRRFMDEEKIYLSPELNLKTIADTMDISERKLSAFFSEVLNRSFYDTINSFRVEEAKRLLKSDAIKSHSILGIGLSCGFSSKSSFYRIFKKTTNMSPLAYRESYIKESHRT